MAKLSLLETLWQSTEFSEDMTLPVSIFFSILRIMCFSVVFISSCYLCFSLLSSLLSALLIYLSIILCFFAAKDIFNRDQPHTRTKARTRLLPMPMFYAIYVSFRYLLLSPLFLLLPAIYVPPSYLCSSSSSFLAFLSGVSRAQIPYFSASPPRAANRLRRPRNGPP